MQMQIVELGLATATAATATCGKLVKSFDLTALLTALQEMVGIVWYVPLFIGLRRRKWAWSNFKL